MHATISVLGIIALYSKSRKQTWGELLLVPMSLSNVEKEQQCTLHWFQSWSPMQKADFMKDLLEKASPCNVDTLFDAMHSLNVRDRPPSIFQCQVKLFTQWFEEWSTKDRNEFMNQLQQIDTVFIQTFNEELARLSNLLKWLK